MLQHMVLCALTSNMTSFINSWKPLWRLPLVACHPLQSASCCVSEPVKELGSVCCCQKSGNADQREFWFASVLLRAQILSHYVVRLRVVGGMRTALIHPAGSFIPNHWGCCSSSTDEEGAAWCSNVLFSSSSVRWRACSLWFRRSSGSSSITPPLLVQSAHTLCSLKA